MEVGRNASLIPNVSGRVISGLLVPSCFHVAGINPLRYLKRLILKPLLFSMCSLLEIHPLMF